MMIKQNILSGQGNLFLALAGQSAETCLGFFLFVVAQIQSDIILRRDVINFDSLFVAYNQTQ